MAYNSSYRAARTRRAYATATAYCAMALTTIASLAFGLLVEMAVYTAEGHTLHIGADILFARFTSAQLAYMAAYTGTAAIAFAIVAIFAAVMADSRRV